MDFLAGIASVVHADWIASSRDDETTVCSHSRTTMCLTQNDHLFVLIPCVELHRIRLSFQRHDRARTLYLVFGRTHPFLEVPLACYLDLR